MLRRQMVGFLYIIEEFDAKGRKIEGVGVRLGHNKMKSVKAVRVIPESK